MIEFKHPLFDEVYFYEKLITTSKQAEKMIREQTAQGNFLVIANEQSGGLGRNKSNWFSPVGGIWLTAALYGLSVQSSLTIFTGTCLHKILSKLFPTITNDLKIKWPNDIFLQNRKLSGILSSHLENEKYHLIGIGLNSNNLDFPDELKEDAISLKNILGEEVDNRQILAEFFDLFAADLPDFIEGKFDLKYFNENSFLKDKEITLDTDFDQFSGKCRGLNKNGAILIELKSGMIQPFYAGTVVDWSDRKNLK
ncbi:MAG: biotin--[acetyl-CoA-carboxylase] ligase [Candidatus Cloacimonetes bacterium]|nr:biotin--[acetyl-CoA-carboxylase] ligase [Candidatus Cloacimonadota bacterium]MCF7813472.1 biotin--[acetyl-CoA-carboxylase] ligase [Candidatus Cloacimonadota bacterium]MCF7869174.1 biotin--[acetyl-CoA-carboxylase] ligase [Candidatus Cloacimonadota bacterium]MCF7883392.1 biotin--[acetyl-CoA-carboxylase] ligase [Candidatus Cloacimonadota bacterium]